MKLREVTIPEGRGTRITVIDAHAAGEPLRVVVGGVPPLPGKTILEKRRFARENLDAIRTALMWEPRGHADMYGCYLTEPETPDGHVGVVFLHNEGYSTMCGHGIVALTTVVMETGLLGLPRELDVLKIDSPAGRIEARPRWDGGRVAEVSFLNVPSFVYAAGLSVEVPGFGRVPCDVAFGGAFYAYVRAESLGGFRLVPEEAKRLIEAGTAVKRAVMASQPIRHPFAEDLGFLYGTIILGPPHDPAHFARNVCVFAEGEVDRSPTGTGVSGHAALHFASGRIGRGEPFVVESLLGTRFTGRVAGTTRFGPYDAVVPEVTGSAHITGRSEFVLDPADPLKDGFFLR